MLQHIDTFFSRTIFAICMAACGLTLWPVKGFTQVFRCGNSYSNTACADAQPVELSAPVQSHGDNHSRVFLCRLGQRQFWSAQPCASHNASMLYSSTVPRHWSWEQQWQHTEREWQRAERQTAVQAPLHHHADTSASAQRAQNRPDCANAEQRIRQLDEMGRRGGSASLMERLRKERRELRDWQFRVGC